MPPKSNNNNNGIDLFGAFFRTRPSILTTVLTTSIYNGLNEAAKEEQKKNKGQPQKQQQQQQQQQQQNESKAFLKAQQALNTISTSEKLDAVNSNHWKKHGIEYLPGSNKFRFLSSDIPDNPKERKPITAETLIRARKVIMENADLERQKRLAVLEKRKKDNAAQQKKKKAKKGSTK